MSFENLPEMFPVSAAFKISNENFHEFIINIIPKLWRYVILVRWIRIFWSKLFYKAKKVVLQCFRIKVKLQIHLALKRMRVFFFSTEKVFFFVCGTCYRVLERKCFSVKFETSLPLNKNILIYFQIFSSVH